MIYCRLVARIPLLLVGLFFFLATSSAAWADALAASDASTTRIIGGQTAASVGPTVALVGRGENSYRGYFCAGTLIHPRWVLTARHCVEDSSMREIDVIVGRKDLRSRRGMRIAPLRARYQPRAQYADVALLYLSRPWRGPLSLLSDQTPQQPADLLVRGWGAKTNFYPGKLQEGRVLLRPTWVCSDAYLNAFSPEEMICAGSAAGDACWGDSGGPLLYEGKVIGVVSGGGPRCAEEEYPGIFARLHLSWIRGNLQNPPRGLSPRQPGPDTSKATRPIVFLQSSIEGDRATREYQFLIETWSNYTVAWAKARLRGDTGMRFCSQQKCIRSGEWFWLRPGQGRRHADAFFPDGNRECFWVDSKIKIRGQKSIRQDSSSIC